MDSNKILIKLYVPRIEEQFDVWIPVNKKIYNLILLLIKGIKDFEGEGFDPVNMPMLYDKITAEPYDINDYVGESNMRNGSEIILI